MGMRSAGEGLVVASIAAIPLAALVLAAAACAGVAACEPVLDAICHRIPERSLSWSSGMAFPLCARCTGLWAGAFAGVLVSSARSVVAVRAIPSAWWIALAATVIGLADGLGHVLGFWDTSNTARIFSGGVLGAGAFFLAGAVARTLVIHAAEVP